MNAGELFHAGRLGEAIAAQLQEVKANPADQARRVFLFELLAFDGDLERARRQADAIRYDDTELDAAVATYRKLADAEGARRRVFEEGEEPRFFGEPPGHARLRLEAADLLRRGQSAEARAVLDRAAAASPDVHGRLNGRPFSSLTDCDDVLAGVLEVMAGGDYFWVPLEEVRSLRLGPPQYPRDLLWAPALLEREDAFFRVFLPVLYPGTYRHPDERVKLGRITDWKPTDDEIMLGVGAHLFWMDDQEIALLEWREFHPDRGARPAPLAGP
jgi:type VI secretion system protein ImpE